MSETTERPTNLVDLLDQLVLPPEPDPVSMMPQTGGWVVLALVVLAGLIYLAMRRRDHIRQNAYRAEALSALQTAGSDPVAIATVLRRCALAAYPRKEVAALTGDDWLAFLDETAGTTAFSQGAGRVLTTAPYQPGGCADAELLKIAQNWVRAHDPEALA